MNVKERIRSAVFQCFPEYDVAGQATSWPSAVLSEARLTSERVAGVATLLHAMLTGERRGTVVLLAPEGFKGPRLLSKSFVGKGLGSTVQIPFELYWALPPGGWIVAHGCTLSDVFVGSQSQTQGPDAGSFCLITDETPIGQRLSVRIRFD